MESGIFIPFNKPYLTGKETDYIIQSVASGKISGDGMFTKKCHHFFERNFSFRKCLLTTSCTDALEMAALLLDIKEGDEVIMPSFTFVSTANAFILRGAKIIFCDSNSLNPNIDVSHVEELITVNTKAIVVVHYAGIACDMDLIMDLALKYNLFVVEDAAQAINSYYKERILGSIGHMSAFSFHETKNIQCGEGGMLVINDERFIKRAEILREKGTNRSAFFRGEVDKYNWVDVGSSFLPSDILAAFLFAQLEHLTEIQKKRIQIWEIYFTELSSLQEEGLLKLPASPKYASNNAHMFYIICSSFSEREKLIEHLKSENILAVFHYLSLHQSPFYRQKYEGYELPNSAYYSDHLLRLPLYIELDLILQMRVIKSIRDFYSR